MDEQSIKKRHCTLSELNALIKSTLDSAFPEAYWVAAEIAELKCNQKGHCYLELIEKDDNKVLAQIKATVWAYEYRRLCLEFEQATGESLKPGMRVLLLASVNFHEVYGLSLNVRDIDPTYTMGEMARKKKEVVERLKREGIIDLNKDLPLPLVPQRIAVISSPTAAGYGDFFNQLDHNSYGYRFIHTLFPAMMQGKEAERSIISALNDIGKKKDLFDVVVIIRGGGSAIDLSCFDGYDLSSRAAIFPLPVITGIGHEKDDTVVDIVAHTKLKTPTAVAEFLISGLRGFEEGVLERQKKILTYAERLLQDERYGINTVLQRLSFIPLRSTSVHLNRMMILERDLRGHVRQAFQKAENRLAVIEEAVKHLDPLNLLRRGFSITRHKGKIVKDASHLKKWAVLETRLHHGTVTSIVQNTKEATEREQRQTTYLLPGFE